MIKILSEIQVITWELVLFLCDLCFRFFVRSPGNRRGDVLLIRLDAIGDYVLFRNFIEVMANHDKFRGRRIHLLGNEAWKDIFIEFDQKYVDNFFFVNRKKFYKNLLYRYKFLMKISQHGYDQVICPIYSRDFFLADSIVACARAKEKIGSQGDLSNINLWQKFIGDRYYTRLIPSKKELVFEFNRNLEFFEGLLECKLCISKPCISLPNKKIGFDLPPQYAVLFIGGGFGFRKWGVENFAVVSHHLKSCYGFEIVICGGSEDVSDSYRLERLIGGVVYNLVGKTSLVDLVKILYCSQVLISNETSAPHFAVALDTTEVFVVSNGNHLGRFTPYPDNMTNKYHAIYHPVIEINTHVYHNTGNGYGNGSDLSIDDISASAVIKKIDKIMKSKI